MEVRAKAICSLQPLLTSAVRPAQGPNAPDIHQSPFLNGEKPGEEQVLIAKADKRQLNTSLNI